ncbi:MAG: cation:proton antiporter [Nakamurella multipartita]
MPSVVIAVVLLAGTAEITWLDLPLVVYELVVGALIGAARRGGAWLMRREALPAAGLYPLATIALIGGAYAVGVFTHASGFLACYVAAVVLGNSRIPHRFGHPVLRRGLGWLAQIGLFVMLGLYVDPTGLPAALVPGLLIGLFVLLVARPASVVAAALPFRPFWREQIFLSWSGLRGAVPIVLAMIPLMNGVEYSSLLLDVIVVGGRHQGHCCRARRCPGWPASSAVQSGQAFEIEMEAALLDEMNAHVLQVTIPRSPQDARRLRGPAAAADSRPPFRC